MSKASRKHRNAVAARKMPQRSQENAPQQARSGETCTQEPVAKAAGSACVEGCSAGAPAAVRAVGCGGGNARGDSTASCADAFATGGREAEQRNGTAAHADAFAGNSSAFADTYKPCTNEKHDQKGKPVEELINGFTGFAKKNTMSSARLPHKEEASAQEAEGHLTFDPDKLAEIEPIDRRWSWLEIDLNAIRNNVRVSKNQIGYNCRLCAVVKADAYGHGAVRVAKTALNSGAEYLAVATVQEGIELREALINAPILLLCEPPKTAIPLLLGYKIMPSIYSPDFAIEYAEAANAYGVTAPYHLAINTGMNRIGVRYDQVVEFLRNVSFHAQLELKGVFTHFATADCAETFDFEIQARRFVDAVNAIQASGFDPGIVHCANSAALLRYPNVHFDMARLGISLYGYHPCVETRGFYDLQPAMSVHARITDTRTLGINDGVSYGLHYRSNGGSHICTLPLGYADGFNRLLSGKTSVIFEGRLHPQVGNICMDQCMFEYLPLRREVNPRLPQVGDEVLLVGKQGDAEITIDWMAQECGTIPHEITIGLSHRMPRLYV